MQSLKRSRVGWNTSIGTISRIVILGTGFLITPIILANLGVGQFGVYAVIGSLQAYFGVLDLGIGGGLTRYMTYHSERGEDVEVRGITTFGLLFYLLFAIILWPVVSSLSSFGPALLNAPTSDGSKIPELISIMFGLFIYSSLSGVLTARLAAVHRLDIVAIAGLVGTAVFALLVALFLHRFPTIKFLLLCTAAQITATMFVSYISLRKHSPGLLASPKQVSGKRIRELFSFGLWTQVNNVSALINLEADKLIISRSLGVAEVSPYQVANRLALINRMLPLQLLSSLLPHVTAQISNGITEDELQEVYRSGSRSLMLATLSLSGLIVGGAGTILLAWLGQSLGGAALICTALVISYAVNNLTGLGTTILRAEGRPKLETYYAVLSASLNIVLTIIFIRRFGLAGVVLGTIIGNSVGSVFFLYFFHKIKSYAWWHSMGGWLVKLVSATAIASVVMHYCLNFLIPFTGSKRFGLLLALIIASIFYTIVFLVSTTLLQFWEDDDRRRFDALKQRVLPTRQR